MTAHRELMYLQTSMFVPDPVISLSIKPTGTETPNFSRALNRFQKEDPTFRVHIDSESQEVRSLSHVKSICRDGYWSDHYFWNG